MEVCFCTPKYNIIVLTGDTIQDRQLGPTLDHTTNSSSADFIYWNQQKWNINTVLNAADCVASFLWSRRLDDSE
jgi:hypothetical protein